MKQFKQLSLVVCLFATQLIYAQNKPLTLDDYKHWNRIVSTDISPNGQWMSYGLRPNGGDDTLYVKHLDRNDTYKSPYGSNPTFSENSQWVSYLVRPNEAETEKLRKARKPIFNTAELMNLETGDKKRFERAQSMAFSNDGKFFVVLKRKTEEDKSKHDGQDLIVYDLLRGTSLTIGNVKDYAFNKKGDWLAYTVDAADMSGNGLYAMQPAMGTIKVLDQDSAQYNRLTWDDAQAPRKDWAAKGRAIAVLKGTTPKDKEQMNNQLLVISDFISGAPVKKTLSPSVAGFPDNMVISELSNLTWTSDLGLVSFGLKEQSDKVKMSKDTIANVDVWHWKDERIQTVQMRRAAADRRFTHTATFDWKAGTFKQLTDEAMRSVSMDRHPTYGIGRDEKPYINDVNWGISPADYYRVGLKNGERTLIAKEINRPLGTSPDSRYFVYQKDTVIYVYDAQTNKNTDISSKAPVKFMDLDHPYPHEKPPYGIAGWSKDGKAVILNHKYDLYVAQLDGSKVTNLTAGMGDKEEIRFRVTVLDREEDYVDLTKPVLLEAYGEWTKKSGYFTVAMGKSPQELYYQDMMVGRPMKARTADRIAFTQQTFEQFPDYYIATTAFKNPKKVTNANPQQAEYAWGKRVLVDYTNSKGEKLQATLALPANYDPNKKYPMVVYFYEKMSDRHHQYAMPVYDDRPHASTYASNGYLFLMPDNVFEEGRPGTSSLDCITAAVEKVIDLGYADPNAIGLQGHSWGGYQSSFILTQTTLFKCVVTGAPPTNLESFYNNIYGSSGTNHHGIMEIGQVRMGRDKTPWSAREAYQRENPMFHAPNIKTPFMILHGTADGAVDWSQGLEFYNAARRLGKEVIFLSYPGEGHHLANEANQKDFLTRMQAYFDHHLKGAPAPAWMTEGVPHLDKLYDKAE